MNPKDFNKFVTLTLFKNKDNRVLAIELALKDFEEDLPDFLNHTFKEHVKKKSLSNKEVKAQMKISTAALSRLLSKNDEQKRKVPYQKLKNFVQGFENNKIQSKKDSSITLYLSIDAKKSIDAIKKKSEKNGIFFSGSKIILEAISQFIQKNNEKSIYNIEELKLLSRCLSLKELTKLEQLMET